MTRFRYAASAAVLSLLAPLGVTAHAAAVEPAPQLVSISYLGAPYARQGWVDHPVAEVTLSGPVSMDTAVMVTSSDPMVAQVTSGAVTVPAGMSSAPVPITALQQGPATLTATLGADTFELSPPLQVGSPVQTPNLLSVTADPASVQPGDSATGTVVLDFLGAPGGTTVTLASDHEHLGVPVSVVVPEDQDRATFPITTDFFAQGGGVISATLGDTTQITYLDVEDTVGPGTTITGVTVRRHTAAVRFTATETDTSFRCRLDSGKARFCTSPQTYRRLSTGRHRVTVTALDNHGNPDPTPATRSFRIKR